MVVSCALARVNLFRPQLSQNLRQVLEKIIDVFLCRIVTKTEPKRAVTIAIHTDSFENVRYLVVSRTAGRSG